MTSYINNESDDVAGTGCVSGSDGGSQGASQTQLCKKNINPLSKLIISVIKWYQKNISRYTPSSCRFMPTCSAYAITAVTRFGAIKGGYLTLGRFLRCNPFCKYGYDPVPVKFYFKAAFGGEMVQQKLHKTKH